MLVCLHACYVLVDLVSKFVLHSLVFIIRLVYAVSLHLFENLAQGLMCFLSCTSICERSRLVST